MLTFSRKKTPTVLQLEQTECGAAVLGMILGYYGRFVPLAELREACGVSRDGSKASNIVKAAERYGLTAKGVRTELEEVEKLDCPLVVFWEFRHFVVVEGFTRSKVFLNDPARGHRTVSREEFDHGFTGVALEMQPGERFKTGGHRPKTLSGLWKRLRPFVTPLLFCLLTGLLLVLPRLATATYARVFLDAVIIDGRSDWLRPLILVMVVTLVLETMLSAIQQIYLRRLRIGLEGRFSREFFQHLLQLPMKFYDQRVPGEIVSRSQLNAKVGDVLSGQLTVTCINLFTMVLYGAVMLYYSVTLTLLGVLFALCNFVLLQVISARRVEANMMLAQDMGQVSAATIAGIQGMETIKASGFENGMFAVWGGLYARASRSQRSLNQSGQLLEVIPEFLSSLLSLLILMIGAFLVIQGDMTIGMLIAFSLLMNRFVAPVSSLVGLGSQIQELRGDLLRLDDVLCHPAAGDSTTTPITSGDSAAAKVALLRGELEVQDLSFGYSALAAPLINGFNFSAKPGQRIALVGGSGSGKSTIAKLLAGLYEPWSGQILFDGCPRRDSLLPTGSVGFVSQELFLFEGTVRDNLSFWDTQLSDDALYRACDTAALTEVINKLPGRLDFVLQEGGLNLSGGQRQQLEIARALLRNPAILLLDEATSALDPRTESVVMNNLRGLRCTCVIVAHRLSTIRDCDEILVLKQGELVERGTHDALWAAGGAYQQLLGDRHELR